MSKLKNAVEQLAESAGAFWNEYLRVGPGALNEDSIEPFDKILRLVQQEMDKQQTEFALSEWKSKYEKVVADLVPLFRRCVERNEGLSFVTGEAGLIPRKDQHDLCESSIVSLRELARECPY